MYERYDDIEESMRDTKGTTSIRGMRGTKNMRGMGCTMYDGYEGIRDTRSTVTGRFALNYCCWWQNKIILSVNYHMKAIFT